MMVGFRGALAAIAVAAVMWGQASAQEAERLAQARELLTLMQVDETISDLFDTMSPMMAASVAQEMRLSASERARLGEILAEEFRAAGPEILGEVSNIYAQRLNEQEMREIITFLRSPSGQALQRTQNEAEGELERVGQVIGMRVALQALTRFNQERSR